MTVLSLQDDIGMPLLLQRRFRLCVGKDVQSTQMAATGVLALTDGAKAPGPDNSMAGLKAVRSPHFRDAIIHGAFASPFVALALHLPSSSLVLRV